MNKSILNYMSSIAVGIFCVGFVFFPLGMMFAAVLLCCSFIMLGKTHGYISVCTLIVFSLILGKLAALPGLLCCLIPSFALLIAVNANQYFKALCIAAYGMLLGIVCYIFGEMFISKTNLLELSLNYTLQFLEQIRPIMGTQFAGGGDANLLIDSMKTVLVELYYKQIPAIFVSASMLFGIISLATCRAICKKRLLLRQPFSLYKLPRSFGVAICLTIIILYQLCQQNSQMVAPFISIYSLFTAAFALQGLALFAFTFYVKNYSNATRNTLIALISCASVFSSVRSLLMMIGIIEMIFRFRDKIIKLPKSV